MSHSIGISIYPCLVKQLIDSQFVYKDTAEFQICMRDSHYKLLKNGYIFQKKVKRSTKEPVPGTIEIFELICMRGGTLGGSISTEKITEPYIIKQILISCFTEFSKLDQENEASLSLMFEKLKTIGIYEEISTIFEHEYFKFKMGNYQIHPKMAIVFQYERYVKKGFDPLKFKDKFTIGTLSIEKTKKGSDFQLERQIFENSLDQIKLQRGPEFYNILLETIGALEFYPF